MVDGTFAITGGGKSGGLPSTVHLACGLAALAFLVISAACAGVAHETSRVFPVSQTQLTKPGEHFGAVAVPAGGVVLPGPAGAGPVGVTAAVRGGTLLPGGTPMMGGGNRLGGNVGGAEAGLTGWWPPGMIGHSVKDLSRVVKFHVDVPSR